MDPITNGGALASLELPTQEIERSSGRGGARFDEVMSKHEIDAEVANRAEPVPSTAVSPKEMTQRIDSFIKGISSDEKRLDRMMSKLSRGGAASSAELIQMQAVTYRYSQRVELVTKVVDKLVGGVKQAMNTQV